MDYQTNFPDGFTGKDEPETNEYLVSFSVSQIVEATSREEAEEIGRDEMSSDWEIDDVEVYRN